MTSKNKDKRDDLKRKYGDIEFDNAPDDDLPPQNGMRYTKTPALELMNESILERLDRIECLLAGKEKRKRG